MRVDLAVQLVATFDCSHLREPLQRSLRQADIAGEANIAPPTELSEHMLAPSRDSENVIGTIVLVRLEDWLRDSCTASGAGLTDPTARLRLRARMEELLSQLSVLTLRGRPVWLMVCPSNGWVAEESSMATLCRTMTNLFAVRVRNMSQVELLTWPACFATEELADRAADAARHVPFTQVGYDKLGDAIAVQLAASVAARDPESSAPSTTGSPELAAFLAGLNIKVTVAPATAADQSETGRILRTAASFSLAGENPTISDSEVEAILAAGDCYTVSVADRLADYGISGVIAARATNDELLVEAFSLSCTILGKQVEYALLPALAEIASRHGLQKIAFTYQHSGRNQPTLAYLKTAASNDSENRFVLPVADVEARIRQSAIAPGAWTVSVTEGWGG
jgi:hypothetical protein